MAILEWGDIDRSRYILQIVGVEILEGNQDVELPGEFGVVALEHTGVGIVIINLIRSIIKMPSVVRVRKEDLLPPRPLDKLMAQGVEELRLVDPIDRLHGVSADGTCWLLSRRGHGLQPGDTTKIRRK